MRTLPWLLVGTGLVLVLAGLYLLLTRTSSDQTKSTGFGITVSGPVGFGVIGLGIILLIAGGVGQSLHTNGSTTTKPEPSASQTPGPTPSVLGLTFSTDASPPPSPSPDPFPTSGPAVKATNSAVTKAITQQTLSRQIEVRLPKDGQHISGKAGVLVAGTAVGLNGDLWVFDSSPAAPPGSPPADPGLYRDTDTPVVVAPSGQWSFTDAPIGDPSNDDIGQTYTITVVLAPASSHCDQAIAHASPNQDGDTVLTQYAADCVVVTKRNVIKTAP